MRDELLALANEIAPVNEYDRLLSIARERWAAELRDLAAKFTPPTPANGPSTERLRERDPAKPSTEQGLFRKYEVRRTDGKYPDRAYFVLDVDHDPAAIPALKAYAAAVEETHPLLAAELCEWGGIARRPDRAGGREEVVSERKYSVAEIDRMRAICRRMCDPTRNYVSGQIYHVPPDQNQRWDRQTEDMLRTYMLNGTDPEELEKP